MMSYTKRGTGVNGIATDHWNAGESTLNGEIYTIRDGRWMAAALCWLRSCRLDSLTGGVHPECTNMPSNSTNAHEIIIVSFSMEITESAELNV